MDFNLENLLNELNAGQLIKSAEDEGEKDEKKEDVPAFLKKDEGKEEKSEKSEDKEDEGDEDKGSEKKAADLGAEVAREVMSKLASYNLENNQMNKQASTAGQSLAQTLLAQLRKQASAGDVTTTDGIAPGSPPSKTQRDVAQQNAEGDSAIKPMPTGDGIRNSGTINQIFDAVVADTVSQGAASQEQVHETGVAQVEGAVEDHALPNQVKTASEMEDELLKAAAVQALVDQGVDFSQAVDMVKQAEAEMQNEFEKSAAVRALIAEGIDFEDAVALVKQAEQEINFELEKSAALSELMNQGVDFDQAVEMVKQASAGDMNTADGVAPGSPPSKTQRDVLQQEAEGDSYIKPMLTGDGIRNSGTINEIFDAIVADAMAQGAASQEQVHTTGVASQEGNVEDHAVPSQVKSAAINELVAEGYDFDTAVEMVKEAGRVDRNKAARQAAKAARKADKPQFKEAVKPNPIGQAFHDAKQSAGQRFDQAKDWAKGHAEGLKGEFNTVRNTANPLTMKGRLAGVGRMAKNPLVLAGAGAAAALGGGAYALAREKKAAFDALIEAGVDFEKAAELVAQKSYELYGE